MKLVSKKELRRDRRLATELPLRFAFAEDESAHGEFTVAATTGISSSGLSFSSAIPLPISARLFIQLHLPGQSTPTDGHVTVMRIVHDVDGRSEFEYGVKFEPPLESDAYKQYIRSIDVTPLLDLMVKKSATHLHLSANCQPLFRINRELTPVRSKALSAEAVEALALGTLNSERLRAVRRSKEIEFVLEIPGVGRWHTNIFHQKGNIEAVFQVISERAPLIEELGLPATAAELAFEEYGLILVCGLGGSGKSTTVASLIEVINQKSQKIILTVEDSIEFLHTNVQSVIRQREVGIDTHSYLTAVRQAVRQNADVIVAHRVDDAHVMDILLHAAESGRLVIAVVSALDTLDAVQRLVDLYPQDRRDAARSLLAAVLKGMISQVLLPKMGGTGLVLAAEVLLPNDRIRGAIRNNYFDQVWNLAPSVVGAQSLDVSLRNLIKRGLVDRDLALNLARDIEHLRKMLS